MIIANGISSLGFDSLICSGVASVARMECSGNFESVVTGSKLIKVVSSDSDFSLGRKILEVVLGSDSGKFLEGSKLTSSFACRSDGKKACVKANKKNKTVMISLAMVETLRSCGDNEILHREDREESLFKVVRADRALRV